VRRYLVGQRPDYPPAPVDAISADWLVAFEIFRERALAARDEALMAEFPSAMPLLQDGAAPWRGAAATVWRNMFSLMGAERTACLS
jgi:hypothetical protein